MANIAVLNGRLMPLSRAVISVEDRGYSFGDGVYEVVRVYGGVPFLLREHLWRFERSAQAIQLSRRPSPAQWERWARRAVAASGHDEAKLYLQLTRGVAPRDHVFPPKSRPTALVTVRPLTPFPIDPKGGVRVVTMPDIRWGRCDIKSLNLLPNVLAKQYAKQRGVFEALFIRPAVGVTEGSSSNLFLVARDGTVVTPPAGPTILSGITREAVIALARQDGLKVIEAAISPQQLAEAAELFLTGTLSEVVPVVRVDDRPVGLGRPGPFTLQLAGRFGQWVRQQTGQRRNDENERSMAGHRPVRASRVRRRK